MREVTIFPFKNLKNYKSCILNMINIFSSRLQWLLLIISLFQISGSLGEMMCEDLPNQYCAFAISSSGKPCVLENYVNKQGKKVYLCKTSEVVVERMSEYIKTDACVRACGVDRKTIGISFDALLEPQFISRLCSPSCYQNCPNIADLYSNLAVGEGGYLPFLCENQRRNPHRAMVELISSGAAQGPISSALSDSADTPVSTPFSGFSSANTPVSAPSPFSRAFNREITISRFQPILKQPIFII